MKVGRVSSASVSRELPVIDDRARMGMVLADPGPEVSARMRGAPGAPGGLLVAEILPGGPAFFAGLHRGDLLAEVAGRPVRTGEDWLSAPEAAVPAKPVDLVLFRHGRRLEARAVPVEDATGVRELDGPLWVFSLKRSAPEDRFSLLWGLLWRSRSMHEVLDLGTREEHTSSCEVGALLDIFRYRSRDGRSEMRFLWVIPIYSRSRFTLESRQ